MIHVQVQCTTFLSIYKQVQLFSFDCTRILGRTEILFVQPGGMGASWTNLDRLSSTTSPLLLLGDHERGNRADAIADEVLYLDLALLLTDSNSVFFCFPFRHSRTSSRQQSGTRSTRLVTFLPCRCPFLVLRAYVRRVEKSR